MYEAPPDPGLDPIWGVAPDGMFDARGIIGQGIRGDPRLRLVVSVLAAWPAVSDPAHGEGRTRLMAAIGAAVDRQPQRP